MVQTTRLPRNQADLAKLIHSVQKDIHALAEETERICEDASRLAARIERIETELLDLIDQLEGCNGESVIVGARRTRPRWSRVNPETRRRLKQEAERGVGFLRLTPTTDGAAAEIEGIEFHLTPVAAALVGVLLEDRPPMNGNCGNCGTGGTVPAFTTWKNLDHIAKKMQEREAKKFSEGSIRNTIARLRAMLWDQGINPYLIQTKGKLVRLALIAPQCPPLPIDGASHPTQEKNHDA
jgi:plasmid stabilization system protein ParE